MTDEALEELFDKALDELFKDKPPLLKVSEVADILRLSNQAVNKKLREDRLPGSMVDGNWLVITSELKEVVRKGRNRWIPDAIDSDEAPSNE